MRIVRHSHNRSINDMDRIRAVEHRRIKRVVEKNQQYALTEDEMLFDHLHVWRYDLELSVEPSAGYQGNEEQDVLGCSDLLDELWISDLGLEVDSLEWRLVFGF